jgi:hypothetical protein
MSAEPKPRTIKVESSMAGIIWAIGWMFTMSYAHLDLLQSLFAILAWPYYLGLALR